MVCRYTWDECGAKEIATIGKEAKDGFTVMVGHNAAGDMLPFQLIAKGTTHACLDKFVKLQPGFKVRGGGAKKPDTSAAAKSRYTKIDGKLVDTPPFYLDEATGHILCAGDKSHWTNASTLRLWIRQVVWPAHVKDCQARGLDPLKAKCILHFDAYPVHISAEFRAWLKAEFPQILLVYVPANCTSKVQIADLVLNRPLKCEYTRRHMLFLMKECRLQMSKGLSASEVKFDVVVSKCAAAAMSWLLPSYAALSKVDMRRGLANVGYDKCWDDAEFRLGAMLAMDELFSNEVFVADEELPLDVEDTDLMAEEAATDAAFLEDVVSEDE